MTMRQRNPILRHAQTGNLRMSGRNLLATAMLLVAAFGSWYLATKLDEKSAPADTSNVPQRGFYLRDAKILGTGEDGTLVYEIQADYAEQQDNQQIEFENVSVRYSTDSQVPWQLTADKAVITGNQEKMTLTGHVLAVSDQGFSGKVTELRTDWLELEPESFLAYTDRRVQIRIGERSLTATGMQASLQENRLQLISNVSGKFVP